MAAAVDYQSGLKAYAFSSEVSAEDIGEDEWTVLENGYTVYYHSIGGGTLWSNLAQDYLTTSEYSKMTGIYGIIFYKLKNLYKDDPTTEYTKAKEEKERI